MSISAQYSENSKEIVVSAYKDRKLITRTVTNKSSGLTTVEVFKEGSKKPVETYVYNKII